MDSDICKSVCNWSISDLEYYTLFFIIHYSGKHLDTV